MTETKEEILDVLAQIINLIPEQRFGQLLYNYLLCYVQNCDTFYTNDNEVLTILKKSLENLKINIDK